MKILIINWRSIRDPQSGGAELATLEITKRWVKKHGADVTWLSTPPRKNIKTEIIDGVKFKYLGQQLQRDNIFKMLVLFPLFYLLVILEYFKDFKGKVDVVIDQSHGVPFLTPLYIKEKRVLYIHEVADVIWDKMFKFPINILGKFSEKLFLSLYKNEITITGSEGTKNDLLNIGFKKEKIKIVNYATNLKILNKPTQKFESFTILFLNRVVKMKGPDRAIKIFAKVKKIIPEAHFIIAGKYDKDYVEELNGIIKGLSTEDITFKGYISETEKIDLLQKSHVLINTSYKEGWGIVNLEANSQGTPAVAFNVEGCRESIKNGESGYLAEDEEDFVKKIIKIKDIDLGPSSIKHASKYSYEDKSEEFWRILNE
jgi:glycosyltransferase involved in cell wall biosynthesis